MAFIVSWGLTLYTDGIFHQKIHKRAIYKQKKGAQKKVEESFHIKILHCLPKLLFVEIE
jgi:hypothetical protein